MDFKEYTEHCKRTESVLPASIRLDSEAFQRCMKIAINSSNLMDLLKKRVFYNRETDKSGTPINKLMIKNASEAISQSEAIIDESGAYIPGEETKVNLRYMHGVVGLYTEAGEMLESLHKSFLNEGGVDKTNLVEELGDICWYLGILCDTFDLSFGDILEKNVAKLKARYGEKFSEERANNRDLATELQILQGVKNE